MRKRDATDDNETRDGESIFEVPAIKILTECAAQLLTFDYTVEQRADIEISLRALTTDHDAIQSALARLQRIAIEFYYKSLNRFGSVQEAKWRKEDWAKVARLSDELYSTLDRIASRESYCLPPSCKPLENHLLAVVKLKVIAVAVEIGGNLDNSYPLAKPKTWYQFNVLDVWTDLGGKLKFSRHPIEGKIRGPLARYFSAVTQPVLQGGSLESLPDIVKRQKVLQASLEKWRLDTAAVTTAEDVILQAAQAIKKKMAALERSLVETSSE